MRWGGEPETCFVTSAEVKVWVIDNNDLELAFVILSVNWTNVKKFFGVRLV